MFVALLVVSATLFLIHGYVAFRIYPLFPPAHGLPLVYWLVVAVISILPVLPLAFRFNGVENRTIDFFSWIGYGSLGFFSLTFMILFGWDLILALLTGIRWAVGPDSLPGRILTDSDWSVFLEETARGFIVLTCAALTLWGLGNARKPATVYTIQVPVENLPADLEGFRIVQISDIHLGPTIKRPYLQRIVDRVQSLQPDLIAVTGDLVDGSVTYLRPELEPLRELQARYGVYFVTGNHEYYSGVAAWLPVYRELGLRVLQNESNTFFVGAAAVSVVGIPDPTAIQMDPRESPSLSRAMQSVPPNAFTVLLAHQPGIIDEAARSNVDLVLSGHTHGGQLVPFSWLVRLAHPYIKGLHRHHKTWIYVNRGTGYWGPPLRLGVPGEITVLELRNT
ncbi:MAG: metallophosphoesterase [Candidatus Neomarinimicrobiota bacterium]|nr:MAG: metallophosphoesterase [Candidatus Neomarinimicrobiota bacterium]